MELVIIGAGGYGQVVFDVATQLGCYDSIKFLDDNKVGDKVLGKCAEYFKFKERDTYMYPAFGNNELRLTWINRLKEDGITVPTIIAPSSYVSTTATIGSGCVILPHAVVNTNCVIKDGCLINAGAIVDHNCILEEGVHVCIGSLIKAENRIPSGIKIEAGVVVKNGEYPIKE